MVLCCAVLCCFSLSSSCVYSSFTKNKWKANAAKGTGGGGSLSSSSSAKCQLEPRLKGLIEQLWDENTIVEIMKEQDVDLEQMPLGKLSKKSIDKGHSILNRIRSILEENKTETSLGTSNPVILKAKLEAACTEFFSVIPSPHPKMIMRFSQLQKRVTMLNILSDIALAQNLASRATGLKHHLDEKYETMGCDLKLLPRDDPKWSDIKASLDNTCTHKDRLTIMYGYGKGLEPPQLLDVFEVNRKGEAERFKTHNSLGNRKLLWHGTNIAVVVAICSTGLRIMPHSGGRVGRGIYFASENGKSANYVATASDGTGIMFLCETVLGKEKHIIHDDPELRRAPSGYNSVVAQGHYEPDPTGDVVFSLDGKNVILPTATPQKRSRYEHSDFTSTEYLVYNESQVRLRYLLKLKMPPKQ
mmetsp:Transcript_11047/g.17690  ORF Transcript_11047/g.17690 Transcript_11047/m.17690 type:complete len:415 (+) Transcript_11047:53-1297(+)